MAAVTVTLGKTNTLSLPASTPYQLVTNGLGNSNAFILNTGPGNLYIRYGQPPTGPGDPASLELPVGDTYFTNFPISGGQSARDGVYVLADQPGDVSVLNLSNPLPGPSQALVINGGGGGGGQNQSPWLSNINGGGYSLSNVSGISVNGNINITGQYRINGVPISTSQSPWTSNINAAGYALSNINAISALPTYDTLAITANYFGVTVPGVSGLFVAPGTGIMTFQGDIDITGTYKVNGIPFAALAIVQSAVPPTTLANGSLWFDSSSLVLYLLYNGAWIGV